MKGINKKLFFAVHLLMASMSLTTACAQDSSYHNLQIGKISFLVDTSFKPIISIGIDSEVGAFTNGVDTISYDLVRKRSNLRVSKSKSIYKGIFSVKADTNYNRSLISIKVRFSFGHLMLYQKLSTKSQKLSEIVKDVQIHPNGAFLGYCKNCDSFDVIKMIQNQSKRVRLGVDKDGYIVSMQFYNSLYTTELQFLDRKPYRIVYYYDNTERSVQYFPK